MQMQQSLHARTARDSVLNSSGLIRINFLNLLDVLINELVMANQKEIESIKQELSIMENATLHIHHRGERFHFSGYDKETKRRFGISEDNARIYSLARRGFLECQIKALENHSLRLVKTLDATEWVRHEIKMDKSLKRYAKAGLDLSRILFTEEQNEWIDQPYTPNPFHLENLVCRTNGGVPMRSNSETKIGSFFETVGYPYRYDDLVTIHSDHSQNRPFKGTYFADFKVPNLLGGITIHEHFGAFQLDNYPDNALKRLNDYRGFSIYELGNKPVKAEEFTWSFAADLNDSALFHRMIRRMLFPL